MPPAGLRTGSGGNRRRAARHYPADKTDRTGHAGQDMPDRTIPGGQGRDTLAANVAALGQRCNAWRRDACPRRAGHAASSCTPPALQFRPRDTPCHALSTISTISTISGPCHHGALGVMGTLPLRARHFELSPNSRQTLAETLPGVRRALVDTPARQRRRCRTRPAPRLQPPAHRKFPHAPARPRVPHCATRPAGLRCAPLAALPPSCHPMSSHSQRTPCP